MSHPSTPHSLSWSPSATSSATPSASRPTQHARHPHRGAHLTVHYATFYHHGVDCGDGTVIHMSRELGGVRRSSFEEFADGRDVYIEELPARFSPDEVVRRAAGRLGEGGYNVVSNNCEHFATWCREGHARSRQVGDVKRRLCCAAVKTAGRELSKVLIKEGVKEGTRLAAREGVKAAGKTVGKTLVKGGGLMIAADAAQIAVEHLGGNLGLNQEEAKTAGRAVGCGAHVAIGAACGGPVGAVVGAAVWGLGEVIGGLFD
ncbi:MAG: hypothetical protein FJ138_01495 [Deltaproteobacteria bacterium]|nr:hypothetical protein [Deltaproteobacteria bacterium]